MSGLDLSQNILSLQAGASAGDYADVGAEASVDFRGSAQLKRGIMLEAGVGAMAEAHAGFHKFLAADAQVRAEASARLKGQIQSPLDLFSESGVAIRLQAVAELALSAQLAIGLSMGDFIALAEEDPRIDGIYMRLLEIFLEELEIQAGVRGRVAYTAMAYLNLVVAGRLIEDQVNNLPPGFTIAMNCGAGLEGGAGWGLFANLGLKSPRRLIRRSVDAIVDEALLQIRAEMSDPVQRERLSLLRAPAKMALRGGFEVGLALAESGPTFADSGPELARRCVEVILEEAQRFLLEQIALLGVRLIKQGLDEIGAGAAAWDASKPQRDFLGQQLANPPEDPFEASAETIEYWSGVVNGAVGVGLALGGGLIPDDVLEPIALIWSAAQLAFVTTQRVTDASIRASFFGAFTAEQRIEAFKGQLVDQAPPPAVIQEFINGALGRSATAELLQDQLVEFLTGTALDRLVEEFPEIAPFLEIVAGPDASPAALSAAASAVLNNAGAFVPNEHGDIDPEATLRALTEGLEACISVRLHGELAPLIHDAVGDQPELSLYIDEVIFPTIDFTVGTVFDSVLDWSFGNVGYRDALRDACSSIVMKLLGRSLVVTTDVLAAYASEHVGAELVKLADDVDDPGGLGDQLAVAVSADSELVGEVLHETLLICSEVFGPMPPAKRAKIRNLLYSVLDAVPSTPDAGWLDQLQQDLFIPDGPARAALLELGQEMGGMLGHYVQEFYTKVLTRVAELTLEELAEVVDALVAVAEEWVEEIEGALAALLIRLAALPGEIIAALNALNAELSVALGHVQDILSAVPESPEDLKTTLTQALYSSAHTSLLGKAKYQLLPGFAKELALAQLDAVVDVTAESGLLDPVLLASTTAALGSEVVLQELQTVLAELRDVDPDGNYTEQVLDVLLDRVEAAVRSQFGDSNPKLELTVAFSYWTPAIGLEGTWAYIEPEEKYVSISLGKVELPLDQVVTAARAGISSLGAVEAALEALLTSLSTSFALADAHEALTLEQTIAAEQQPLLEAQVAGTCGTDVEGTILSPAAGGLYEFDPELDLHITNGCEPMLGLGALEQPRVFVFLNQERLDLARFAVEVLPEEPTRLPSMTVWTPKADAVDQVVVLEAIQASATQGRRQPSRAVTTQYATASAHSVYQTRGRSARASKTALHRMGRVETRQARDEEVSALGPGLRLRLDLPLEELQQGLNTLTLAVTTGRGETHRQTVSFVAVDEEASAGAGLPSKERPAWTLDQLPPHVVEWIRETNPADRRAPKPRAVGRNGRRRPQEGSGAFWIEPSRERSRQRAATVRTGLDEMSRVTARVRDLKTVIETRGLQPVKKTTTPRPEPARPAPTRPPVRGGALRPPTTTVGGRR